MSNNNQIQKNFDTSMDDGTKTKATGIAISSAGAFLAVGSFALTTGLTAVAAAPVVAMLAGAGVLAMLGGKIIHKQGLEKQDWIKSAYSNELDTGMIKEKPSIISRMFSIRKNAETPESTVQNKMTPR